MHCIRYSKRLPCGMQMGETYFLQDLLDFEWSLSCLSFVNALSWSLDFLWDSLWSLWEPDSLVRELDSLALSDFASFEHLLKWCWLSEWQAVWVLSQMTKQCHLLGTLHMSWCVFWVAGLWGAPTSDIATTICHIIMHDDDVVNITRCG